MHKLRYRQVHLDFHTSPDISDIGAGFDKNEFQNALRTAHVDSITLFSKCHHGLSYHPTNVGRMHPGLKFDLLGAQMEACREIGVAAPVYVSAGLDQYAAFEHPEWRFVNSDGNCTGWSGKAVVPGFVCMCFNTDYLDYLCAQIEEAVRLFPDANGVFLDIIAERDCCCPACIRSMRDAGLNPEDPADRMIQSRKTLLTYYARATAAARCLNANMPVFHNSGNVSSGRRDILQYFSHLELESLPTGGWGYDHFPLSARYVEQLGLDYLGMTGKFNSSWGEFGGLKHPNALRYECAAMLAFGAKCSVGDQAHPSAALDEGTYRAIGAAYSEVEASEPWCVGSRNAAEIGLVLNEGTGNSVPGAKEADTGASRVLLEEHMFFDALDADSDFSGYKLLILPDHVRTDDRLKRKIDEYIRGGGRVLLSGESGFGTDGGAFLFDVGAEIGNVSPFCPDYILPHADFRAGFVQTPMVMYSASRRVRIRDGFSFGDVFDPYFNRSFNHFCSHQHTPNRLSPSGFACACAKGSAAYIAHCVFSQYHAHGGVEYRKYAAAVIRRMLGGACMCEFSAFPSTARASLRRQDAERRLVLHLLYAEKSLRGGTPAAGTMGGARPAAVEVIEDLVPLQNVGVRLRTGAEVENVELVPGHVRIPFMYDDGALCFTVPSVECAQMVQIDLKE